MPALSPDFEPAEEDSPLPAVIGPPDLVEARFADREPSLAALALPAAEELPLPDEVEVGAVGGETTGAGCDVEREVGCETDPPLPVPGGKPLAVLTPCEPPRLDRPVERLAPPLPCRAWALPAIAAEPPFAVDTPAATELGCVRATPGSTVAFPGALGSGPPTTAGQPSWEMKMIRPKPTKPTRASRAIEVRRSLNSMLPPATPTPPRD